MHCLIYIQADDSIRVGNPSQDILNIMTGSGKGFDIGELPWEIIKRSAPSHFKRADRLALYQRYLDDTLTAEEGASFTDWEIRLSPYYNGLADGGLSEVDAIAAIRLKDEPDDCVRCLVMEDADLPDRYFRDAWEWSD